VSKSYCVLSLTSIALVCLLYPGRIEGIHSAVRENVGDQFESQRLVRNNNKLHLLLPRHMSLKLNRTISSTINAAA
jgi:hypothetical protein